MYDHMGFLPLIRAPLNEGGLLKKGDIQRICIDGCE